MGSTILNLILAGTKVFTDERRRHFSKELMEKTQAVDREKAKRFPEFNSDRLAKAERELDSFLVAYQKEFEKGLAELQNKLLGQNNG